MTDRPEIPRHADPADPLNAASYHTGKPCIEKGCDLPAGTHWSPLWCQPHNSERMDRITRNLEAELARHTGGGA